METNMRRIAIVGAGGLAQEIWDLINYINLEKQQFEIIGFYDDAFSERTKIIGETDCLGPVSLLFEIKEELSIVFGIANRKVVLSILKKFGEKKNFSYPNLVHPKSDLGFNFKMGHGNVITSQCQITVNVKLGNFNFFNTNCCVGHNVEMGDFNCFMPRVQISGDVIIGNLNEFNMNSSIVQGKKVGDQNQILANTLLTKSIKNQRKYFGIPAKRIDL
ncbi:acetyltransferase [Nonlabens sp. SCSIO 43208]|uniref:acetyltransferase n=1 Tax=Nonlabens sp. SCSIO 43208 TaxID=2793009 RepID=UPI003D6A96C5